MEHRKFQSDFVIFLDGKRALGAGKEYPVFIDFEHWLSPPWIRALGQRFCKAFKGSIAQSVIFVKLNMAVYMGLYDSSLGLRLRDNGQIQTKT
jgi:hypothetical protein